MSIPNRSLKESSVSPGLIEYTTHEGGGEQLSIVISDWMTTDCDESALSPPSTIELFIGITGCVSVGGGFPAGSGEGMAETITVSVGDNSTNKVSMIGSGNPLTVPARIIGKTRKSETFIRPCENEIPTTERVFQAI